MNILNYSNYQIEPTQEAFLIKPIRELYNADRTKNKDKFLQQMSILYFMVDPRSSYSYIVDEELRYREILKQEGLPLDYKIDAKLEAAMEIYKKHIITTSYKLLQSTRIAVDKLSEFLENIDLYEEDKNGKPKYTISQITQAIKQVPQLSKDVIEAERIVSKEIEEEGRARGGNNKTLLDDGFDAFLSM